MSKPKYLRSKLRRGRWFHTYRRGGVERSLDVHGLHPTDPKVFAKALKELDKVAYVRFASVYRSFEDIREFGEEIARLGD